MPETLSSYDLVLSDEGTELTYTYDTSGDGTGITALLQMISDCGLSLKDMQTKQSSLEEIFVNLVHVENGDEAKNNEANSEN